MRGYKECFFIMGEYCMLTWVVITWVLNNTLTCMFYKLSIGTIHITKNKSAYNLILEATFKRE